MTNIKSKISSKINRLTSKLKDYSNREETWVFGGPDFESTYAKIMEKGITIYRKHMDAQKTNIKKIATAVIGIPILVAYNLAVLAAAPVGIPYTFKEERAYQANKKEATLDIENIQNSQYTSVTE